MKIVRGRLRHGQSKLYVREIMEYLQSPDTSGPKTTWMVDVNTDFEILSQDKVG